MSDHEPSEAPRPDPAKTEQRDALLANLFHELFQTERSAEAHCLREARRLGHSAPAAALVAIAEHARRVNAELPGLARKEQLPESKLGQTLGHLFSLLRELIGDRLIDQERSYRGTVLGARHGLDVVRMIRHVADASGRVDLGGFCTRWLEEREPLVVAAEHAMSYFAHHPQLAASPARSLNPLRRRALRPAHA